MSVGAGRGRDTREFGSMARETNIRPHVGNNAGRDRGGAIDVRTARRACYPVRQAKRPLIEKKCGWMKPTGGMKRTKPRGLLTVAWPFVLAAAACNLWSLRRLAYAEV